MNLNQLRAFCTLSRTLHYSRASEELQIAQPSLSRMIAQAGERTWNPAV
ncbi:MAG: LysR family transcriptional regulator [[Clostridium] scindens]